MWSLHLNFRLVMRRITVFCGSNAGNEPVFLDSAYALGQILARQNIGVVYGGARIGLMGAVADGALSERGEVIGVLPNFLRSVEIEHTGLTELFFVESMHERKAKMDDLSDGVVALPGGYGTLEEFFEMLTWAQLGLHKKPVALLNIAGFYDGLIEVLENMVHKGFLKVSNKKMLIISNSADDLLHQMKTYCAPETQSGLSKIKPEQDDH
jgi:uncharacterized protein (TIGR00730 family)